MISREHCCTLYMKVNSKCKEFWAQGKKKVFYFFFFFLFWLCCVACGLLVPQPGIEPRPPTVTALSSYHWATREVPLSLYYCIDTRQWMFTDLLRSFFMT